MIRDCIADVWTVPDVLTAAECSQLRDQAIASGFQRARLDHEGRRNSEAFLKDAALARHLQSRLQARLPTTITLEALWPIFEFYRYGPGDFVAEHRDQATELAPGTSSNFTLVLYLNEDFNGGETRFPSFTHPVYPKKGAALLFRHELNHAGAEVHSGEKYLMRTAITLAGRS